MTQKEQALELLGNGPLSSPAVAEALGANRPSISGLLSRLNKEGRIEALNDTRPYLYALAGKKTCSRPRDVPSLTNCARCGTAINKKTRKVERRPTGDNGELQLWGFCKPCFRKQQKSRRRPPDLITLHISSFAADRFALKKGLQHYGR